ncbi:type I-MYXAN CRISPR-associated endonuclease Cas4/Cas1 [Tautonia sociabilis]|uniref:CRISPR-associated endonuclease Cas1 n=1 Tax=Tautonia sociabilis TaxID=2080755 RepID=A0A432MCU9_9BACT|nr:type I-MYXAN CRISPR-associated endonuclease Cas1 [Tautonia sociabilis]RUL82175.1 type I-MYXAN CRISPR-associated endonuclease Cas1 [Tautonia sociabilis]
MIAGTHDPPLRVISLHDLGYCRRLFYLTEVEGLQAPNAVIYAGRELHASLEADEEGDRTQLELEDRALGLVGKVDAVRRRDGSLIPYEHKRGRSRHEGGTHTAWPSDRLQVIAYAVLIEAATGQHVSEGRIRYHANNVTVRIPITDLAKRDLAEAVAEARRLRESTERPPVAENERLCVRCSLAPVCLPEEARASGDPHREAVRLFPPDRDGTSLHVLTAGARVGRSGETLVVTPPDGEPSTRHPIREIDSLLLHGHAQATTQALALCADLGIPVHWLSTSGRHVASLTATAGQVQRRVRQYRALADEETCLRLARALARAKIEGQHRYLLRATRGDEPARQAMLPELVLIRSALSSLDAADSRDALRGFEGSAAAAYFRALGRLLGPSVPDTLRYSSRSRRPPLDRFNALLGFGYGLLHAAVMRAVLASGLEPSLGFFHTPRSAAYPLVLDLMELFRVPLWDMPLIGSLNRGQWDPDADFVATRAKVWLSDAGRRKAIGLFEARLDEQWKHPVLGYSLSYARTLELEARLLEKEWSGEPGLFARMRLR